MGRSIISTHSSSSVSKMTSVRRLLIELTNRQTQTAALKQLSLVIADASTDILDAIADAAIPPLCHIVEDHQASDASVELACAIVSSLIDRCGVEIVACATDVVLTAVAEALTVKEQTEEVRLALADLIHRLVVRSVCHFHQAESLLVVLLRDECNEVLSTAMSIATAVNVDAEDVVVLGTHLSPLLCHKNSKFRISALHCIDRLLRSAPWKGTFPLISALQARDDPNEIPVSEFFEPTARINYFASLAFDPHEGVRFEWFKSLIVWVTELEDRLDIESHLSAYILTGCFDPSARIREAVMNGLNGVIADTYVRDNKQEVRKVELSGIESPWVARVVEVPVDRPTVGARRWVCNNMRAFIRTCLSVHTEFSNCSLDNSARLLRTTVQFAEDGVAEYLPDILATCQIGFASHAGELYRDIVRLVGMYVEESVWWPILSTGWTGSDFEWELLHVLLTSDKYHTLNPGVMEGIIVNLERVKLSDSHILSIFNRLAASAPTQRLVLSGFVLYCDEVQSAVVDVVSRSDGQAIVHAVDDALANADGLDDLKRILQMLIDTSPVISDPTLVGVRRRVMQYIDERKIVDESVHQLLKTFRCDLCPLMESLLVDGSISPTERDMALRTLHAMVIGDGASVIPSSLVSALSDMPLSRIQLTSLCLISHRLDSAQFRTIFKRLPDFMESVGGDATAMTIPVHIIHLILSLPDAKPSLTACQATASCQVKMPPIVNITDVVTLIAPMVLSHDQPRSMPECPIDQLRSLEPVSSALAESMLVQQCLQVLRDCIAASPVEVVQLMAKWEADGYQGRVCLLNRLIEHHE